MVVVGADVHKRTHTFVAVDEVGRELGSKIVKATTDGHQAAIRWARKELGTEDRLGDRGLPASVGPVGAGSTDCGSGGRAGAAEDDG